MQSKVAILPWGDTIEDFLDTIGVSLEQFATEMSGGWLFSYVAALRSAGMDACIVCVSAAENRRRRIVNPRTQVATIVIPRSPLFRVLGRMARNRDRDSPEHLPTMLRYSATPAVGLHAVLHKEGCTHILCQEYEYPRFDVAARVAHRIGIGAFATYQGGTPPENAYERRIRRRTIRSADGLIIAPRAESVRVRAAYGVAPERIATIPNPLDLDVWRPSPRAEARRALGFPEDCTIAICHCRIDYRRKGIDILVEAWRRLARRHPGRDLRLHLIGSGRDDALLEAEIAREPVPGLRWSRGYSQDRPALRRELSAADLYVLASRHEGFPVAPLEAMACGLPCVLTDIPGSADILADGEASGGVTVPSADAEALSLALERLVCDAALRQRLAAAARRHVETFASVRAVGARLAAFLQRR